MQRKKSIIVYASAISIVGMILPLSATPGIARQARNATQNSGYQLAAASSYAYEPQTAAMTSGRGRCWISTDASRPYGYMDTCANPLAFDPALSPTYNGVLHGE